MLAYIIVVVYLILAFLFSFKSKKDSFFIKFSFFICSAYLIFLSAFRGLNVGNDTEHYSLIYKVISHLSGASLFKINIEFGFTMFNKMLSLISLNSRLLFVVTSVIIVGISCYFIYKESESPLLSLCLYILFNIYFFHLTGIRQSMASSFLLLSYLCFIKNKKVLYFLFVLLSISIHNSAIIFLLLPLLNRIRYSNNTFAITVIFSFFSYFLAPKILLLFLNIFSRYSTYLMTSYSKSNYFACILFFLTTLVIYAFCHYTYAKNKENIENNSNNILLLKILSIDVCIKAMAINLRLFSRMNSYFNIFSIVCIVNYLWLINKKKHRFLITIVVLLLFILYWSIISYYRPEWTGTIPYSFN